MRSLISVLFLVIFCSVQMTSSATMALDGAHSKCCGELSKVKIPVKLVASYYWTSSSCPRQAIVFQTKAGREFCVDPETTWVSGHIDKVVKRTTNATTTTAAASTTATKTQTQSHSLKEATLFFI
ncbi:C-C motif chemokine 4-like [Onychostoma macrolepis]|uniref:C-C motif chemokine 4-like n=1 Tax=Onychostoma macrolepis TaxID=369639 RepID=UPI00272C02E6|nr:C-C motif chemokine 4-like [Onychostoma macrolepis]